MSDELVEIVGRAIALADEEDYMEDYHRYDARARAAIAAMDRYNMEAMRRALHELGASALAPASPTPAPSPAPSL